MFDARDFFISVDASLKFEKLNEKQNKRVHDFEKREKLNEKLTDAY